MFTNAYISFLKMTFRHKQQMFWLMIFPIALSTLFRFALSNIDSGLKLNIVPAGVVNNTFYQNDTKFKSVLERYAEKDSEKQLFELTYFISEEEADESLKKDLIDGYFLPVNNDSERTLIVKKSGIHQTILKEFSDSVTAGFSTFENIKNLKTEEYQSEYMKTGLPPFDIEEELKSIGTTLTDTSDSNRFTQAVSLSANKPQSLIIYYYALLAMVCMYASFAGISISKFIRSDLSVAGMRIQISAVSREKLILANVLSGITATSVCSFIAFCYMSFILGIDFGTRTALVLLTLFLGNILGVTFGSAIAAIPKITENAMTAISVTVSVFGCFLSGMMMSDVKYMVLKHAPFVAAINPAGRISDAFYSLYCYSSLNRYYSNVTAIILMIGLFLLLSIVSWRKMEYEKL